MSSFPSFFKRMLATSLLLGTSVLWANAPTNCGCDDTYFATDPRYEICLQECLYNIPVTNHIGALILVGFLWGVLKLYCSNEYSMFLLLKTKQANKRQ